MTELDILKELDKLIYNLKITQEFSDECRIGVVITHLDFLRSRIEGSLPQPDDFDEKLREF